MLGGELCEVGEFVASRGAGEREDCPSTPRRQRHKRARKFVPLAHL
jgi:hypothetical protein